MEFQVRSLAELTAVSVAPTTTAPASIAQNSHTISYGQLAAEEEGSSSLVNRVDALLFYFDPRNKDTFVPFEKEWHRYVEKWEPSIAACVAHEEIPSTEEVVYLEWCVEHGFELISLSMKAMESKQNESMGTLSSWVHITVDSPGFRSERQGIARVREVLEANHWDGLVMKERITRNETGIFLLGIPTVVTHVEEDIPRDETQDEDLADEENVDPQAMRQVETMLRNLLGTPNDHKNTRYSENTVDGDDDDVEPRERDDLDEAFAFISRMKEARGTSHMTDERKLILPIPTPLKEKGNALPDDQRRTLAAKMAMEFASRFLESDDDEEEDE